MLNPNKTIPTDRVIYKLIMNKMISVFRIRPRLSECRYLTTRLTPDGKEISKRNNFENRITLIGTDNSVSITNLKNAESLSSKRELKLVKIQDVDSKIRRPVYKLMTKAQFHEEDLEKRKEKQVSRENATKGEKLITMTARMGEHDFMTSVKKMSKLVQKQYEVRVIISGDTGQEMDKLEQMYTVIEKNVKSIGKIVQKRCKGNSLRFQLLPDKNQSQAGVNLKDSGQSGDDKKQL